MRIRKAKGNQAVVEPGIFGLVYRKVAPSVILVFEADYMHKLVALCGYADTPRKMANLRYYEPPQKGLPGIAGPAVGAPQATIALEVLIACGVERVLGFGVCGSIDPEATIGKWFVPAWALAEEGTSGHYFPGETEFAPDEQFRAELEGALSGAGHEFLGGGVWTTDAIFRETADKVTGYQARGMRCVEMEMSALCAVAKFRAVRYAALMVVSDELFTMRWKPGFRMPGLKKSMAAAMEFLKDHRF